MNDKYTYKLISEIPITKFVIPKKTKKITAFFITFIFIIMFIAIISMFFAINHIINANYNQYETTFNEFINALNVDETVINPYKGKLPNIQTYPIPNEEEFTTKEIAEKLMPSTVGVTSYISYNGLDLEVSQGSGIIITENGFIVTNAHVITQSTYVEVELSDGLVYVADVVGMDVHTDLAVLKIDQNDLQYAKLGNPEEVYVGDRAIAIGNPGGYNNSVTQGIISALDREILINIGKDNSEMLHVIQTDASINPGNSGGALLNSYGQVIGVNSAKMISDEYEGIGFAIPINIVKPVVEELIKNSTIKRDAKLGISAVEVDDIEEEYRHLYPEQGLVIVKLELNCDLLNYNVVQGDTITKVEGENAVTMEQLIAIIKTKQPGDYLNITLLRNSSGEEITIDVKLVAKIEY